MKKKRHKRNKDRFSFYAILTAGVAGVLVVVLIAVVLTGNQKDPAPKEALAPQNDATQEETMTQDGDLSPAETETEKTVLPPTGPAQVGSMDDDQDPQASASASADTQTGALVEFEDAGIMEGETTKATLGIDVSKYQGTIDWAAVKASGVEFAMIRAGYRAQETGILYEDPGARYNMQEAAKNGVKVGVYFFSTAVNETEAAEEAAMTAQLIAQYPITYPVAYNCEGFLAPNSRQHDLTVEQRTKNARAFLDAIQSYGYTGMFYASRNEMEGSAQWDMSELESRYLIWVSQYPQTPYPQTPVCDYSGKHAMWQYTNQGQVDGISAAVDVNVAWFGADWEVAAAKNPDPPQEVEANPEVGIDFQETDGFVTAKDETNLRNIPTTRGSSVIYLLKNPETVQRTGIGSNGWDRVIYNGQKLYAVHDFLKDASSEDEENKEQGAAQDTGQTKESDTFQVGSLTFQRVSEAVTARDKVNLRDYPSSDTGNVVGTLSYGQAVVRIGISGSSDTGWSCLDVNGQTVYASSRLLATSMDYKQQEKPTLENPEAGRRFTAASGVVKAKSVTNLRTLPTTEEPSQVVTQLSGDMTANRIAVDVDKGWTKLEWNGQILYAVTSYLMAAE